MMYSELSRLPPLFAAAHDPKLAGNDTIKVSCIPRLEAQELVVEAVDIHNNLFQAVLGEKELSTLRADQTWPGFFNSMMQGFYSGAVKIADADQGLTCTVNPGKSHEAAIYLRKSNDQSGTAALVNHLITFYQVRSDPGTYEKRLEDLIKKEKEARCSLQELTQEEAHLKTTMTFCEQQKVKLHSELPKLDSELKELLLRCEGISEGAAALERDAPLEPDCEGCLTRIPIAGPPWHRKYDMTVLRLIKSKFTILNNNPRGKHRPSQTPSPPLDPTSPQVSSPLSAGSPIEPKSPEGPPVGGGVIQPWLGAEFERQLRALPEDGRHLIMKVMDKSDKWDYDVWTLQDFTDKGALFYTAYALFIRWNFLQKFGIDEQIAINFFSQVEAGYHPNPYHNAMHGADVLHIVHYICLPGKLKEVARLTEEDCLAALVAGMIHDYDHPGLNNSFHVKVQSFLATLYNDRSILENHHCAEVFELVKHPSLNLFHSLTETQRRDVRETIVEMVLSTDMGNHAKIFNNWKRRIGQDHDLHKKKDDQRLALSMAIKMADISNCGRPEHLYLKWGQKLAAEFFLQGDNERNRGDAVSPFMDRFAPSMAKSQIAFMNYIVIPMFESIAEYLPEMHFSVDLCESNKNYWSQNDDSL